MTKRQIGPPYPQWLIPRKRRPAIDRFMEKVTQTEECWLWVGARNRAGRGVFNWDGSHTVAAPRAAYRLLVGPIPDGLFVCHHCDNAQCVRPDHLWLGTHNDNMADMKAKGRARGRFVHPSRPRRMLGSTEVQEIRRRAAGGQSGRSIARDMGLAHSHVFRIIARQQWPNLEDAA